MKVKDEIRGQYRIVGYVDDLEDAVMLAQKKNMGQEIVDKINNIHDDIVELEPLLVTEEDHEKLQAAVEKLIDDINGNCRSGNSAAVIAALTQLKTNVDKLKKKLS